MGDGVSRRTVTMKKEATHLETGTMLMGEIRGDTIFFRTVTGNECHLRKSAPPIRRARFFDELFDAVAAVHPYGGFGLEAQGVR
jgi:hypothetical protein